MIKKIGILAIILGLLGIILFFYKSFKADTIYEISGLVTEVKNNAIVVTGAVGSLNPEDTHKEEKTIEFSVTSATVLINHLVAITSDQIKSGESFSPKIEVKPGAVSDLVINTRIRVKSKNNLFANNKATAVEISYILYDFKLPSR